MFVHCCHCLDCQRQTGSAFVLNAIIEADRIVLASGEPTPVAVPTDSGRPHEIYRCPTCQTAMWSDYGRRPIRFVRIGTLEDPRAIAPDVTSSAAPSSVDPVAGGCAGVRRLLRARARVATGEPRTAASRARRLGAVIGSLLPVFFVVISRSRLTGVATSLRPVLPIASPRQGLHHRRDVADSSPDVLDEHGRARRMR